ncbi:MAG: YgaP family membrane protein [Chloroflexota bacterium]
MIKNMGQTDRLVRVVIGVAALGLAVLLQNTLALILLGVVGLVMLGTSFLGTCPLYIPFRFSTRGGAK